MEYRRDDDEVELMVISVAVEHADAPQTKRRRLMQVVDKGGASSSSATSTTPFAEFDPTKPFVKFVVDLAAAE